MRFQVYRKQLASLCNIWHVLLALCWCVGLILGVWLGYHAGSSFILMMRRACGCPVSIFGLMISVILPFLFSAAAVYFSESRLILAIAGLQAFGFGIVSYGVGSAFGSAGWLIRFLLLFSNSFIVPVLFWFWLRHIAGRRLCYFRDVFIVFSIILAVGITDYCFISPFLAMLMEK